MPKPTGIDLKGDWNTYSVPLCSFWLWSSHAAQPSHAACKAFPLTPSVPPLMPRFPLFITQGCYVSFSKTTGFFLLKGRSTSIKHGGISACISFPWQVTPNVRRCNRRGIFEKTVEIVFGRKDVKLVYIKLSITKLLVISTIEIDLFSDLLW